MKCVWFVNASLQVDSEKCTFLSPKLLLVTVTSHPKGDDVTDSQGELRPRAGTAPFGSPEGRNPSK